MSTSALGNKHKIISGGKINIWLDFSLPVLYMDMLKVASANMAVIPLFFIVPGGNETAVTTFL